MSKNAFLIMSANEVFARLSSENLFLQELQYECQ